MCLVLTDLRSIDYKMSGCINIEATAGDFGKTGNLVCFNDNKDFLVVPLKERRIDTHKLAISMLTAADEVLAHESHKGALVAARAEIRQYAQRVFELLISQWLPEKNNQQVSLDVFTRWCLS